jgi:hypothetical protein
LEALQNKLNSDIQNEYQEFPETEIPVSGNSKVIEIKKGGNDKNK